MESFRETLVNASRGTNFQFPSITLYVSSYESLAPTTTDQLRFSLFNRSARRERCSYSSNKSSRRSTRNSRNFHIRATQLFSLRLPSGNEAATKISKIDPSSSSSSSLSPYKISKITIPSFARIFETSGRPRAHTKEETPCPPFFPVAGILAEFSRRREGRKKERKKEENS